MLDFVVSSKMAPFEGRVHFDDLDMLKEKVWYIILRSLCTFIILPRDHDFIAIHIYSKPNM